MQTLTPIRETRDFRQMARNERDLTANEAGAAVASIEPRHAQHHARRAAAAAAGAADAARNASREIFSEPDEALAAAAWIDAAAAAELANAAMRHAADLTRRRT